MIPWLIYTSNGHGCLCIVDKAGDDADSVFHAHDLSKGWTVRCARFQQWAYLNTRKKETPLNYAMKSGDEDAIELLSPAVFQKVERHIARMGDFGEEISSANLIADDDEDEDEVEDDEMEMNSNENGAGITDKDIARTTTDSHSLQPPGPGNVAPLTSENTQKILADVSNISSPALSPMVSPVISPAHSNRSDKLNVAVIHDFCTLQTAVAVFALLTRQESLLCVSRHRFFTVLIHFQFR